VSAAPAKAQPPIDNSSSDKWTEWLRHALALGTVPAPWGGATLELHHGLINVHRSLSDLSIRNAYDDAISMVFDSLAFSGRADIVFALLQLIGYAKPIRAQQLVRRVLFSEQLRGLRLGAYQLHTLALSVASKYTVDDELLGYIDRSVRRSSDLSYLLVCFRARSMVAAERATQMLPHLIAIAASTAEIQEIVRELRGFVSSAGYAHLFAWYLANISLMTEAASPNLSLFEDSLLHGLTGVSIEPTPAGDPYRAGLAAAVLSTRRPLEPEEYAALAQMRDWSDYDVARIIDYVWNEQRKAGWKMYVSSPDEFDRIGPVSRNTISIFNERGEAHVSVGPWPVAVATLQRLDALASGRPLGYIRQRSSYAA